jgi:hypothetical protein
MLIRRMAFLVEAIEERHRPKVHIDFALSPLEHSGGISLA